jgi:carboxymethylenebutenolidase
LVLHPWWGLNATARDLCDRLAAEGFVALAPDLFGGETTSDIARATELSDALDLERGGPIVRDGLQQLLQDPATRSPRVAVLGLSMGAWFSFWLAAEEPDAIASVVVFYGTGDGPFDVTRARFLGHYAEHDDFEPLEGVRALEEQIRAADREVTFHVYPGTGHWFFEPDVAQAFDPDASRLAWDRTVVFLGDEA